MFLNKYRDYTLKINTNAELFKDTFEMYLIIF